MYANISSGLSALMDDSDGLTYLAQIRESGTAKSCVIRSMKVSLGGNGTNYITMGTAYSASAELTLYGVDFEMRAHEYEVCLGMDVNGTPEYIPMGLFTAEKPVLDGENIKVTLYDRMKKFEKAYFSNLTYPNYGSEIISEICTQCGVPYEELESNVIINTKPEGYTCREMISYIAQLLGCFAVINRSGKLEFKWYSGSASRSLSTGQYWDPFDRSENNYTLHRIAAVIGKETNQEGQSVDKVVACGTGTKGIVFANPFFTQEIMDGIWSARGGYAFRPGSVKALGDPRLDPGDLVAVEAMDGNTYMVPVMTIDYEYDGGLSMKISAVGEEEQKDDFSVKGPTTQAMERMSVQLMLAEKLIANKIDADVVEANYVRARELDAIVINSDVINAYYATVDLANVNNAFIENGILKDAIIGSAQIQDMAVTTAKIQNEAVIDSKIASVSANKLTAGTIDAGVITVVNLNAANITVGKINGVQIASGTLTRDNMGSTFLNEVDSKVEGYVEYYISWDSDTTAPGPDEDWDEEVPPRIEGMYIWKKTKTVYGNGSAVTGSPVCLSGTDGIDGEDAVLLKIDSSNGNVFKNNSVATLMTVTIYYGSEVISNSTRLAAVFGMGAYLEWEWQRFGETTWHAISSADSRIADNGFQFALSSDDVDVKVNFRCKLNV